jgi:hypothetical protein
VHFVELLAIAGFFVLGVGDRLRRGRERLETRGQNGVIGGGFDEDAKPRLLME